MEQSKEELRWEALAEKYMPSAREYFYILRLALYHTKGIKTDSSFQVCQELVKLEKDEGAVYACACKILETLYKED